MRILLTGATGFIGRRLHEALTRDGHHVIGAGRRAAAAGFASWVRVDFSKATRASDWLAHLQGVDVVINAVGIIRETKGQDFAALHAQAPRALFDACVAAGVRRVIQISALGADAAAATRYHRSKHAADEYLFGLPLQATILQPSLVFGRGGASARLFSQLACLPVIPLPGHGRQRIQPVHIDDLVQVARQLVIAQAPTASRIPLVGPHALSLREYLAALRRQMRLRGAIFLPVPMGLMRGTAALARWIPALPFDRDALQMLAAGNVGDAAPIAAILGRAPIPVAEFIPSSEAARWRTEAALGWALPLLRISLAILWLATGLLSLGLYPVEDSYRLLARVGLTGMPAALALYGAALLDLGLGLAALFAPSWRAAWRAQMALIAGYTLIITIWLPEWWLHPYGPVLKNIPLLAATWLVLLLTPRNGEA